MCQFANVLYSQSCQISSEEHKDSSNNKKYVLSMDFFIVCRNLCLHSGSRFIIFKYIIKTFLNSFLDVVCKRGWKKVKVNIGNGESYSFKTQAGGRYKSNTKCIVKYRVRENQSISFFSLYNLEVVFLLKNQILLPTV